MDVEPTVWMRVYDYSRALLTYWWILVPTGIVAVVRLVETLAPTRFQVIIERSWPKEGRWRHYIGMSIAAILVAGFLVFDETRLEKKILSKDLSATRGERDSAVSQLRSGVGQVQQPTFDRLSSDLVVARGQVDLQKQQIERQATEIEKQKSELESLKRQQEEKGKPRHVSQAEKQALIQAFTPLVAILSEIKISAPGDGEAQGYAKEFQNIFNDLGIKVDRVGLIIPTSVMSAGIQIVVKDLNKVPDKANKFYQAMIVAGFRPVGGLLDVLGDDEFQLVIASKP
jgi:hypothetical protein